MLSSYWRSMPLAKSAGKVRGIPNAERVLETLLETGERLTALKAEAYALLKQRGYSLPQRTITGRVAEGLGRRIASETTTLRDCASQESL